MFSVKKLNAGALSNSSSAIDVWEPPSSPDRKTPFVNRSNFSKHCGGNRSSRFRLIARHFGDLTCSSIERTQLLPTERCE